MVVRKYCYTLSLLLVVFFFLPACIAQQAPAAAPAMPTKVADKITRVTHPIGPNGEKITQLEVDLQKAPNNMEPVAEPRRIRIDDRANVRFLLTNLSPLDVCTRTANAPTPTPETNVAESFVTTIAGLGAQAIGGSTANLPANSAVSTNLYVLNTTALNNLQIKVAAPQCKIESDPEYKAILDLSQEFFPEACGLIGSPDPEKNCANNPNNQLKRAGDIDNATRKLGNFIGADYRAENQKDFIVDGNTKLDSIRDAYSVPLSSIEAAGRLQAMVDEMTTWATDLHKKYDYSVSAGDGGASSAALPPVVRGALLAAPTELSMNAGTLTQVIRISAGGQSGSFTATPASNQGWLQISKAGTAPGTGTLRDTAPAQGTFALIVTANPAGLDASTHNGSITISGTGAARGTTIVNVSFKPVAEPPQCALDNLREIDRIVDRAKAEMSLLSDNNKSLETAQAALKTAYMAVLKTEDDFKRRKAQGIVLEGNGVLVQLFNLGTDRKATSTGVLSCVSDVDGKTPTTTNINYSLLYQDVPHWSASAGVLNSFQEKKIIGIANENDTAVSPPMNVMMFRVTDQARIQLIPMAFVNYRLGGYRTSQYGKNKEDELVWTFHVSGGFGVNPNTGTNQPEFFGGFAGGLNHFMFHLGVHAGRTESLGGGYVLNTQVPSGVMTAPISWGYHPAVAIGFSVRLAPY